MSHFLRKNKKWIMWGLAIVIIPTFVFWGGYRGSGNGSGSGAHNADTVIASVGGIPITVQQYRNALDEQIKQMRRGDAEIGYKELAATGAADRVLENLITGILFSQTVSQQPIELDRHFLEEQLRKDESFKDDKGKFDVAKWNQWIDEAKTQGIDWNIQYAQIADTLQRQLFMKQVTASARILDADVKKQFEEDNTKLKVKYINVDPKVEATDDQVKAHYEANKSKYDIPEQRIATFAAIPLTPPRPAIVNELVERARKGEDFAELAKKYSEGPNKDSGGDLDWVSQTLTEPPYREPLFKLGVNEISDAIEGPGGYYIYKVEQERTNEQTNLRDVKAREIQLHPKLDDAEQTKRTQQAEQFAAKARETKDLSVAAAAANLEPKTSGKFSTETLTIENVPAEDARSFRTALAKLGKGEISEVVRAPRNLYVATITEIIPAVPQPLEAVREKVVADTNSEIQRSPEHAEKVAKLAQDIQAKAHSLQDIQTMFPDLKAEINETKEFSTREFDYSSGLFWNPREIYQAVGKGQPGAFAGPIRDMIGRIYFVELSGKTPPDETAWKEQYPKDEKDIRKGLLMAKENQRLDDYLKDLRESAAAKTPIQSNMQVISDVLGLNKEEADATTTEEATAEKPAAEATTPEVTLPAATGSAPAPAAESKPADPAPASTPANPAPEAPKAQ
ncbi:MAG: peptidyl-prolyl cis-trans isomerase [Candidatus Hydrogenedentes bacterium]|nr:peptidyl-prolyl cis-trans isomerase [Candidatus Hydrogenedentota bacterium]